MWLYMRCCAGQLICVSNFPQHTVTTVIGLQSSLLHELLVKHMWRSTPTKDFPFSLQLSLKFFTSGINNLQLFSSFQLNMPGIRGRIAHLSENIRLEGQRLSIIHIKTTGPIFKNDVWQKCAQLNMVLLKLTLLNLTICQLIIPNQYNRMQGKIAYCGLHYLCIYLLIFKLPLPQNAVTQKKAKPIKILQK